MRRRAGAGAAVLIPLLVGLALMFGCSPQGQHERLEEQQHRSQLENARENIERIAIVPAATPPETAWQMYFSDVTSAAGSGAGQGAAAGFGLAAAGGISILLAPVTVPAGALIGSFFGAATTVAPEQAAKVEEPVRASVIEMAVQSDFAAAMAEAVQRDTAFSASITSPSAPPVAAVGQAVLETRIDRIGFEQQLSREPHPPLTVSGTVFLRHPLGWNLVRQRVDCTSPEHPALEWAQDRAALLRQEAASCYGRMADDFVMQNLVGLAPSQDTGRRCGLKIEPLPDENSWTGVNVATLTPTIRWQRFPEGMPAGEIPAGAPGEVSDVTYELAIWKGSPYEPSSERVLPVYDRDGLPDTSHTIEQALEPGTWYSFSVRARYLRRGQPELTRWSRANYCGLSSDPAESGEFTREPRLLGLHPLRTP